MSGAILVSAMRIQQLLVVTGLITLSTASCYPQNPNGRETGAELGAPTGPESATTTRAQASAETSPSNAPATAFEEPISLRFVSPNVGPAAGGNEVTIDGQGFDQYPRIAFGGVPAWIRSVTPTEIRVTVPPPRSPIAEPFIVDVTVTNPPRGASGPVSRTLARAYSYEAAGLSVAENVPEQTKVGAVPVAEQNAGTAETSENTPGDAATATTTPQPALVASFRFESVEVSSECPPGDVSIRFIDRSTGGPTEWWWDFGDGNNSKERHQEHCYSTPGMRSVTLTVSNAQEFASTSKIVTVGME